MADNSLSRPFGAAKKSGWGTFFTQAPFAGFLFLVIVGLQPFETGNDPASMLVVSGEGDLLRQVSFIGFFVIIVGLALLVRGQALLTAYPVSLLVVFIWCLVSVSWAVDPGIAVRRFLLVVVVVSCVTVSVDTLGIQRSLQTLRFVLATILIVDCVSLLIIPKAIHLPGEFEGDLIGNWRGMHGHKNVAGPIAAIAALLFYHYALATSRWRDWALFLAAVVFMIGTLSKTAIGFFLISIVISTFYRRMCRTEAGRQMYMVLFFGMLMALTIMWFAFDESIAELMSDPTSFTGRAAIWQAVFGYLRDHWPLGAGFGSFWQVGELSPAISVVSEDWIKFVPHSHNGYLEIFVTTGIIGLALSAIAFIVIPIKQLIGYNEANIELKSLLFSLVCFVIFENLLETVYLNRDRPEWVIFLVVLAVLHQMQKGDVTARSARARTQS